MSRPALLFVTALSAGGCVSRVADHCPDCAVIEEAHRARTSTDRRALVVLVHGAFGFGAEWDPVVAALRRSPQLGSVVFEWRGPFHDLSGAVGDLTALIQQELDESPALSEVLVLAHSAGGPLATRAVLALRVPPGRRVTLAEIDAPEFMSGPPFFRVRMKTVPPMPPGVERIVYKAKALHATHDEAVALASLPLLEHLEARAAALRAAVRP